MLLFNVVTRFKGAYLVCGAGAARCERARSGAGGWHDLAPGSIAGRSAPRPARLPYAIARLSPLLPKDCLFLAANGYR